jgi:hypothetical protein
MAGVNSKIYVNCRFCADYVTNCAASTSVRFDGKEARNRQLHIFAERYPQLYFSHRADLKLKSFLRIFGV